MQKHSHLKSPHYNVSTHPHGETAKPPCRRQSRHSNLQIRAALRIATALTDKLSTSMGFVFTTVHVEPMQKKNLVRKQKSVNRYCSRVRATRDAITWSRRPSVLAPLHAQHHVHGPRCHLHRPETLPTTSGSIRPGPSLRSAAVGAGSTFSIPRVLTSRVPNTAKIPLCSGPLPSPSPSRAT